MATYTPSQEPAEFASPALAMGPKACHRDTPQLPFHPQFDRRSPHCAGAVPGGSEAAAGGDVALPPTLMNKQDHTALCLADTKEWSRPLEIHTVGACLTVCAVCA